MRTWHVMKNWDTQGRAKIKNGDIKKIIMPDLSDIMSSLEKEFRQIKIKSLLKT